MNIWRRFIAPDGIIDLCLCYCRVAVEHAESLDDVQRFSMILTPTSRAADAPSRSAHAGASSLHASGSMCTESGADLECSS